MPKTQPSVEPLPELDNSPGLTRRELEILQLVAEGSWTPSARFTAV